MMKNNKINIPLFPEYSIDMINNVMSLRKPQKQSIKILDSILNDVELSKNIDLGEAKENINSVYPIFTDFEHDFMSLTFALATGVGKTKLMGAFITYLYTNKGIRNFFVVAPNLTIYEKLKNDLGNPAISNNKYVFRGVSCFSTETPNIWVDDDYKNRPAKSLTDSDSINIYIFNISKFNSEERNIKNINEYLGESFFDYLKNLEDLVIIMDESHHYRAQSSYASINDLKPILGLELTATPQVQVGSKTILFQNVVYEYPLSKAIKDGYTRTPYALTRRDLQSYNFTPEELDKTMINDGILHHENIKTELLEYYKNNQDIPGIRLVKPFMLIVCKDTNHAQTVLDYIKSDAFKDGKYSDKVIMVHSNQRGSEKEENIKLLLDVEKEDNKVEIVIHVNILKEGWDVNNLYTIVPLRTATSKTLREQTIGRGLRLPFGKRTGVKMVDSVTITAHDKFDEVIAEAQSGDSIFKAYGIIYAEYQRKKIIRPVQLSFLDDDEERGNILEQAGLDHNNDEHKDLFNNVMATVTSHINQQMKNNPKVTVNVESLKQEVEKDLGQRYDENNDLTNLLAVLWEMDNLDKKIENVANKVMYIPKIKTESLGIEKYIIKDFDLDLSSMVYTPTENDILIKDLLDSKASVEIIKGEVINFDSIKPEKLLVDALRNVSEIDYEKCPDLIKKITMQFLNHYRSKYSEDKVKNICLMYRKDIINHFKNQILQHLAISYDGIVEVVQDIETIVNDVVIDVTEGIKNINQEPSSDTNIKSLVYNGSSKSVTTPFKFDSNPERIFAIACDNSPEVVQWLRPSSKQFNITYNRGHRYEPDFVVETDDMYYLVEIKAKNRMDDPDVISKKNRAIQYCKLASEYNEAHGYKKFRYLFIPHDEVSTSSSFNNLMTRFITE